MTNVNNPHGLRPAMRTLSGGAPQIETFTKAAAYAYAIYKWDPVTELAGVLNGPANGITVGTTRFLGVCLAWSPVSTLATLPVMVSPDAVFEAQGDGSSGTNIAAGTMGYNANLNISTAGGGVTRDNSGVQVNESSVATTSTLDVRILQLLNAIDNAYGANGRVELKFNKHLRNPEIAAT